MDNIIGGAQDGGGVAAGRESGLGPDNFVREGEKCCQEQYFRKFAECVGIFASAARDVLGYLKEQPDAERIASMLGETVRRIEQLLQNRCGDLDKLKQKFCAIEEEICCLEEIKREICWLEKHLEKGKGFCPNVTSGSVIVEDPNAAQVLVAVKNTTDTTHTVRVRVVRDDICPARELADKCLMVSGCCSNALTVFFGDASAYEIEVFGLVPGMTVSSVELDSCKRRVKCSRLTASQFICREGKCS